ncbi:MAG TPA: YbaK/EbsC family protein [Acidimicrobiales bacterium]|nr:MAG: aminoacyl-tRNA deacylase [Actinobacteria bacterium 21-73-9]HQU25720.1 YbaK/EbsC family protein [Acidimicrobiales bacterium]
MSESILARASVRRVVEALARAGLASSVRVLDDSARTAADAAAALGVAVGQIASSIVFRLPDGHPLLVITSGRHRVDIPKVAAALGHVELHRADADYIRAWTGFAIGGVSPVGWSATTSAGQSVTGYPREATVVIDEALGDYDVVWAAAGHPHAVFATTYEDLVRVTGATPLEVADD